MLDGKMLRGLTGTPILRMHLANSSLAEAEPEPLTLANLTTKSLVAVIGFIRFSPHQLRNPSPFGRGHPEGAGGGPISAHPPPPGVSPPPPPPPPRGGGGQNPLAPFPSPPRS